MADLLNDTRAQLTARLAELEPLLKEYQELQAAAAALKAIPAGSSNGAPRGGRRKTTTKAPKPAKPAKASKAAKAPKAARKAAAKRRGGRTKGTGKRAAQALALIQEQPGITIPELAEKMGIVRTYLYRVLPPLQKEGKLAKSGKGWKVKEPSRSA
jgi:hypothetical protein